jgi:HEAT repeat protein
MDAAKDHDHLVQIVGAYLREAAAPRLVNRLLRAAADLRLRPLLPDVVPLMRSQSSLVRASAVRAVGKLADLDEGVPVLEGMAADSMPEVQRAVESALKELRSPKRPELDLGGDTGEQQPALDEDAMSALAQLKISLEHGEA